MADDPDAGKYAKSSVDYSPAKGADRCDACRSFVAPSGCKRVQGKIDPGYWCRLFQKRR